MRDTVRRQRLIKVADAIEADPEHFDYSSWGEIRDADGITERNISFCNDLLRDGQVRCGFVGCIAGWTAHTAVQDETFSSIHPTDAYQIAAMASEYLGLRSGQSYDLFLGDAMKTAGLYPEHMDRDELLDQATGADAAKLLRMVAAGEVVLKARADAFDHEVAQFGEECDDD